LELIKELYYDARPNKSQDLISTQVSAHHNTERRKERKFED